MRKFCALAAKFNCPLAVCSSSCTTTNGIINSEPLGHISSHPTSRIESKFEFQHCWAKREF